MQAAAQRPTLKRGKWAKIFDGKVHKRYYFFNVQTKQSQWTEPPEWASLAPVEIIVGNGKANNNNAKKVVQTVRLNLGSLGATGLAAAKLQKKVEKKLLQQSLSSKKGTSFAQQAKLGKKKKTKTYCAICDVKVNHASLMASHLAGKKHKAALLLFKRTGKLAPGGTKGKGSAASMNSFKIDPAKKAERASRFAAEYVEKVHLGKEDNSHKRIKAWGGDRVEHNADEAIAKLLERKRKAVIADAIEKGLDPDEELRKRKVRWRLRARVQRRGLNGWVYTFMRNQTREPVVCPSTRFLS